jgi:hypothetical protein
LRLVAAADANALPTMLDQLERCQKALADFLEEKRSRFPRFYFIGDECVHSARGGFLFVISSHRAY